MCAECHSTQLRKSFDAATRPLRHDLGGDRRRVRGLPRAGLRSRRVGARRARRQAVFVRRQRARGRARRAQGRHLDAGAGDRQRAAQRAAHDVARDRHLRALPRPRRAHLRRLRPRQAARRTRIGSRLLEEGLYWTDGQIRDEVYDWGSFVQSRMHAKGVTCSDCHDPHSLELRASRQRRVRAMPPAGEVRRRPRTRTTRRARRARHASPATCRRRPTW